jgi:uncharacterized membrane protein
MLLPSGLSIGRLLNWIALGWLVLTALAMWVLWPRGERPTAGAEELGFVEQVPGTVIEARDEPCSFATGEDPIRCHVSVVEITGGTPDGETATLEFPVDSPSVPLREGDRIVLNFAGDAPEAARFQFADFQRRTPLVVLAVLFAVSVVLLGRLRGVAALAGLALSFAVLLWFLLPALLEGRNPLTVAIVAATAIAYVALYLTHGVNQRTTVALLGTLASMALIAVLAWFFTQATRLSGVAEEEATFLRALSPDLDFRGLLLAGVVIGAMGVLDDVTVTQVSAVAELRQADPAMGPGQLYRAALNIGRDHIASTVNTLVLAYAGAALPLLLLLAVAGRSVGSVITGEVVAIEVVRTLVGSIGLVASVPITTALAVVVDADRTTHHSRQTRPASPADKATARPRRSASWDDFAPEQH